MDGPLPFEDLGKRPEDYLTEIKYYNEKFGPQRPNGMVLTAFGSIRKGQSFWGGISTAFKSGNTNVEVTADSNSSLYTEVSMNDVGPFSKADLSFTLSDQNSLKVHVQYLHPVAAIGSSIGLNRTSQLDLSATIGNKEHCVGGEVGFDAVSASCYKYNAGIGLHRQDFSAAVLLTTKGRALKASFIHSVDPSTSFTFDFVHKFSSREINFSFLSCHAVNPLTLLKTCCSFGRVEMLCQHVWRPKALVTVYATYDLKDINPFPRVGLTLALTP